MIDTKKISRIVDDVIKIVKTKPMVLDKSEIDNITTREGIVEKLQLLAGSDRLEVINSDNSNLTIEELIRFSAIPSSITNIDVDRVYNRLTSNNALQRYYIALVDKYNALNK